MGRARSPPAWTGSAEDGSCDKSRYRAEEDHEQRRPASARKQENLVEPRLVLVHRAGDVRAGVDARTSRRCAWHFELLSRMRQCTWISLPSSMYRHELQAVRDSEQARLAAARLRRV